jgi:hypothetical protein
MPFTKVERNEVFRAIASSKLNAAECSLVPSQSIEADYNYEEMLITHSSSGSEFRIMQRSNWAGSTLWVKVGDNRPSSRFLSLTFKGLVDEIHTWAEKVAEWMDMPDLWTNLPDSGAIPGDLSPDSVNTPFTPDEQAAISGQLKDIAESIKKTYELTAEQSAKLDEKFEEAEKASRRMGRKDWGLLFGGALLSLILCDAITPGIMGHILMMVEHGMGHLFGGPPVGGILSAGQD